MFWHAAFLMVLTIAWIHFSINLIAALQLSDPWDTYGLALVAGLGGLAIFEAYKYWLSRR